MSTPDPSLFVVELTYRKPLSDVEAALPAHAAFLDRHFQSGHFLLSGRKVPRTGGIILARAPDKETLAAILAEDPFETAGIADCTIMEFVPGKTAPALAGIAGF